MRRDPQMRLADFFETVYLPMREKQVSHRTLTRWRIVIRSFLRFAGAEIRVCDITPGMIDRFEQARIDGSGKRGYIVECRRTVISIMMAARPGEFRQKGKMQYRPSGRGGRKASPETGPTPGTLWHLYTSSYRPKKLRGGSTNTDKQYRVQLTHFARHLGHEPTLADLDEDVVSAFLDQLAAGRSPYTTNKAYWCLMALWRHAASKRLVEQFPTIPAMREPERVPRAWTIDELLRFLAACREEPGEIDGIPAADWWYALMVFCFTTGERVGAARAIRMADVDLERAEVLIPAEVRKGKTRDMLYRLRSEAVKALSAILQPEREMLFPFGGLCNCTFYRYHKGILRRAGLPTDRKCAPQKLRRTFASYVEAAGGNATAALAHSSRSIAIKSYLDPRICGGKNPSDLLPPIELPGKEGAE